LQVKVQALYDLARILPLASWSGNAVLLGIAAAVISGGGGEIGTALAIPAIAVAVLLQYVAHPINDLADYAVDLQANIGGTGRRKVLISGRATREELRRLSAAILLAVAVIAAGIAWFRPLAVLFGVVGFAAVWAYNLPPLRLSYRPFAEFLIGFPANIAMVVGIAYVISGSVTTAAVVLGTVQACMGTSVQISYFAMDVQTDIIGKKWSTVARFPQIPWCTLYPLAGLGILVPVLIAGTGPAVLSFSLLLLGGMAVIGSRIDAIWRGFRGNTVVQDADPARTPAHPPPVREMWNTASASMRRLLVGQMYLSLCNGVGVVALVLTGVR
jgi:1,4-dihydroxy-2-naphthoate octaprenyltransferase